MNNILREGFWAVLMVCLPLATACVKKAAASISASAEENAKSEVTRRLVQEIANAVADAVAAMNRSEKGRHVQRGGAGPGVEPCDLGSN